MPVLWSLLMMGAPAPAATSLPTPTPAAPCGSEHVTASAVESAVVIDGIFDDEVWSRACWTDAFMMFEPQDDEPANDVTRVALAYDRTHLYLAFDVQQRDVRAHYSRRDDIGLDDSVGFIIDPFGDANDAYVFRYNPLGIQADSTYQQRTDTEDARWDAIQTSSGVVHDEGYRVEVAVGVDNLRFPSDTGVWRIGFFRETQHSSEIANWPPRSLDIRGRLSQLGDLLVVGQLEAGAPVRVTTEVVALGGVDGEGARIGFNTQTGVPHVEAGASLRWVVSPQLTVSATLNPDFSQIEADADQVEENARFAIFLEEKRPFFLEGLELFESGAGSAGQSVRPVYTRTLVRPLYGLKLTGDLGGTTVGLMHVLDVQPEKGLGALSDEIASTNPRAAATVLRARMALTESSHAGVLLTNRALLDGSRVNTTGGIDGSWGFGDHFIFAGQLLGAHTREDVSQTSGSFTALRAGYKTRDYQFRLSFRDVSPEFESDLGFFNRRDYRLFDFSGDLSFRPQLSWLHLIRPMLHYTRYVDRKDLGLVDETLQDADLHGHVQLLGALGSFLMLTFGHRTHRFLSITQGTFFANVHASIEPFSWLAFSGWYESTNRWHYDRHDPFFGSAHDFSLEVSLKPLARLETAWSIRFAQLSRPVDLSVEDQSIIVRGLTRFFVLRDLHVRVIGEGNSEEERFDLSTVVAWEPSAGTAFFVGYDGAFPLDGSAGSHRGFGKFSWTF